MAPVKRTFDEALLDVPADMLNFDDDTDMFPSKKPREAPDGFDLSTYLASDGAFDAVVPSLEIEDGVVSAMAESPWLTSYTDTTPPPTHSSPGFHELPGDASDMSDSDGYSSLFNSPAHVMASEFADPLFDDVASSLLMANTLSSASAPAAKQAKADPRQAAAAARPGNAAPVAHTALSHAQVKAVTQSVPTTAPLPAGQHPVDSVRWVHNSTERKRRLEIRRLFSSLRDLFADMRGDDKISNINTLNRAIDHVAELNRQARDNETALKALRERNSQLRARLPQAAAVAAAAEGKSDSDKRKQLPAALRQLLDHNFRGTAECRPLQPRRAKAL